mmetsp:Transcript_136410/g.291318  ORF Transcript_136410/g.291318 Transcript_136410/m.291318 type:complete len:251 (+) Transcript_136410:2215-2967(+)
MQLPLTGLSLFHFPLQDGLWQEPVQHARPVTSGEEQGVGPFEGVHCCANVQDCCHKDDAHSGNHRCPDNVQRTRVDADSGLLRAVGEIIVPGAGNVMLTGLLHLHEASIEIGRGAIELRAFGNILVIVLLLIARHELILIQVCETVHKGAPYNVVGVVLCIEEERVLLNGQRHILPRARHLHEIRAVGALTPIASIVLGISIRAGPLEVEEGSLLNSEVLWHEVVLHSWVHLHDVPATTADIVVDNARRL